MDIERIRGLPIEDFLARLGHHPAMRKRNDLWYNAPYREEKTPSFKVNTDRNIWFVPLPAPRPAKERAAEPAFQEVEQKTLLYDVLKDYLAKRGIPADVAARHCRQISYRVHGKPYFAIGFQNVSGGWELRSKLFKGCVPPKDISLVSRQQMPTDACDVFEGFFDFLSAATLGVANGNDALVLNSVGNLTKSFPYLDGYAKINCWLDNDGGRT